MNYENTNKIGVLGAISMVGQSLIPLLTDAGYHVIAYSRRTHPQERAVEFRQLPNSPATNDCSQRERITHWICLAPIWTFPEHFSMLTAHRAKRVVALSSTSIYTKRDSSEPAEQRVAEGLAQGEQRFIAWAEENGIEWVILRPTLIYGNGQDHNICEIARLIRRFGFFPLLGSGRGLRQPVHTEDVAAACAAVLLKGEVHNQAYNLSGAERLTYREMVARVFRAMGKRERFVSIPLALLRVAIACLRVLPRFRNWSAAMAERMETDMIFDHAAAVRDFGFAPRPFRLDSSELPKR